ncbi:MAG: alpha/beta fold hydrolase [Gaiellaceae bacterium]
MRLHTERRGEGPLLVCHPGGPGFDAGELHDLAGLGRTHTLLLVDPRGSGRTGPADSYLLDDYVADLEELRADLGLETIDLLGFSHGGLVAVAYAAARPRRVRKLVLACTLAALTDEMQEEAKRVIDAKADQPWHPAAAAALEREEAGDYETPEDVGAMWNEMAPLYFSTWDERFRPLVEVDRLPPEPLRSFNSTPFDLRPELDRIDAETLVITGRDDFVCGPAAAAPLAEGIRGAELVLLEGAGHFAFLEQPEAFRVAVEAFLSSGSG